MNSIIDEVWKNKTKLVITVLTSFCLAYAPFYPDWYTKLPLWLQIVPMVVLVTLNIVLGSYSDVVKLSIRNRDLEKKLGLLKSEFQNIAETKDEELTDLKDIIVSFLEYSHTYQDRILRLMKIQGQFLCIAKSSEGLSEVFKKLKEPKPQLPFSKVLTDWPGAIKPFERMNLFFLPVQSLTGLKEDNIKEWFDQNIIPKVEVERAIFLKEIPKKVSRLAENFSYKYLAFMVQSGSIEYATLNRKFTKELVNACLDNQSQKRVAHMTQELTDIIRTKDFFNIVDWSAFVPLNSEQKFLFHENHAKLLELLEANGIKTLIDVSRVDEQMLANIYKNTFGPTFSDKKSMNLVKKTISGVNKVLSVLRKNGVKV